MGILRLSHVDISAPDLELAAAYYTQVLGLDVVERTEERLFLKCWDERDHHCLSIRYDPRVGIDRFSFKAEFEDDLDQFEAAVEHYGYGVRRDSKGEEGGQGESIRFENPAGHQMEVVHDIAIIQGTNGGLHHFSFWLDDWDHVRRAADILAYNAISIDIGPTRHGITRGNTIYFFDPMGTRNEVFTGGYLADPDFPVITWTEDNLGRAIFYYEGRDNGRFLTVH